MVNPIRFKIFINEKPKRIIVPRKLNMAVAPFNMSKSKINMIEVTKRVGMKNINKSAITIPAKYEVDLIPMKFKRYFNLSSLSVTDVIRYIPGVKAITRATRKGKAIANINVLILPVESY
jgi:hypothetical protein